MPLGFVVVTWRRCRASARTDRQRTKRRSSPCRRNASGSAISATDRDKGRRHGQFLRFMGAMTVSDRLNAHPIRHALAPLHPTRHPRQHAHADWVDRYDVTARRRRYFCYGQPQRQSHGLCLRLCGRDKRVGSSKRKPGPSRVSPTPTTSTQRPAFHADRVRRCDVRRCGGAAVRRCRASARTYGSADA